MHALNVTKVRTKILEAIQSTRTIQEYKKYGYMMFIDKSCRIVFNSNLKLFIRSIKFNNFVFEPSEDNKSWKLTNQTVSIITDLVINYVSKSLSAIYNIDEKRADSVLEILNDIMDEVIDALIELRFSKEESIEENRRNKNVS